MNTNSRRALIGFTLMMSLLLGLGLISLLDLPGWRVQASHGSPGNQAMRPRAAKAEAAPMLASMSTITVNSTADGDIANNGACTLREAMINANNANQDGSTDCVAGSTTSNFITFNLPAGPQTINLTRGLPRIARGLTIIGPGAKLLTVRRNTTDEYRIFDILISAGDVGISGLTINNGFINSTGTDPFGGGGGGGIRSLSNLTLTDCNITGNQALFGGGVYLEAGHGVFMGCNFSFNRSGNHGGAIMFDRFGTESHSLRVNNCTISNNFGSSGSGGIYSTDATLEVTNCTIADNTKYQDVQGSGIIAAPETTRLRNTIIANNNLIGSIISLGNNLASDDGGGYLNQPSDKINTNPLLSPLGDYGGATSTRALLPGSPAINAGNNCVVTNTCPSNNLGFNLTTDQRGAGFNRQVGSAVDIGAFESRGFTLAVAGGNNQSAVLNGAFTNPLSVTVTASGAGEPVNGGRVTFTPPASGASATIAGNPATINSGVATTGTITANATAGAYNVAANAIGATAAVNFALTNNSNTAPTFTPVGAIARQRGSAPGAAVIVGTVADSQTAAGSLTVTQIAGGNATGIIVSGITNTNGTIRALLSASCSATSGTVRFQVSDGALTGTGNLQVNVQSNTAPTVGSYPPSNTAVSVLPGGSTVVTPSSPPSDNGTVTSVTATAAGFSGTLSGNPATGAITITNANPLGLYTVNVTLTDNCGATLQRTFRVVVNTPPTIQASAVTRQKGSPAANSRIATVQDAEGADTILSVQVEGSMTTATKNGVTVSNLAVNAAGQVTADVVATCTATNASFTLTVYDYRGASATATLNVTVTANTAPVLTYDNSINRTVASGGSLSISPATGPSDNVTISSIVVQNQSTYTGTISVNSAGVVSISNAKPIGIFAITIRATDNCGATTDATIVLTVNCPTIMLAPAALPNGTTGASYNATINAGGGATPHTFTTSAGSLPNGLSLSSGGVLSGMPTVANTFSFTVKATDASGCTGTLAYTVSINAANNPPTVSAAAVSQQQGSPAVNAAIATVNDPNQALNTLAVTVNGGASATVNGITVSGISVSATGAVTANVVAACTATSSSFTLTVTDTAGATASATLNVTVTANTAPVLTYTNRTVASGGAFSISPATGPSDNGTIGSVVVQSQGTYTGTISVNSTGVVSISNAKPSGVHTITIRTTDNCNTTTDATFTLTVNCPTITLAPAALPNGTTGASYNATINAGGGAAPYTFTTSAGALPNGLSLSSGGVLSGTPNVANTFSFTVMATDAGGCTGTLAYTVTITAVNNSPIVTAAAVSRQQGSPAGNLTIANVNDPDQALNTLAVTVNGGASATVNGVTVSGISVSATGAVTANVVASCTAINASFTLTVTDTPGATANTTLFVTATPDAPPTVGTYPATLVAPSGNATVTPSAPPADNGSISDVTVSVLSPGFTGTVSANKTTGAVTIQNAGPLGTYEIQVRFFDECGGTLLTTFNLTVNDCGATLSQSSQNFAAVGGTGSFNVTVNSACAWSAASNNPGFITVTSPVGAAAGSNTVNFTVASHSNPTPRTGTITVAGQTFTVRQGAQFADVPVGSLFYEEIGKLSAIGVTQGCGNGNYCPDSSVTREQMAAFLSRALGVPAPPTPASQRFSDVSSSNFFYPFIEEIAVRQITTGCAPGIYCPTSSVTREQMAAFLIRALHEPGYTPSAPASQRFTDVTSENFFYAYIEELAVRQITVGCAPGIYCPASPVTRGQMAAFLVRAFGF